MSEIDATDPPRQISSSGPPRRTMRWMLGVQIGLAGLLIFTDLGPALPGLLTPSAAPELDQPTRPGDQTRRYRPDRPVNPGPGVDPDMPRRLTATPGQVDGAPSLALRGAIEPGDGARISAALRESSPTLVILDSPGGSVSDALEIGRSIRDVGAATRLEGAAICLSACPYIFAGGTARQVGPDARLGVHQHSFGENTYLPAFLAVEDVQRGQADVLRHLGAMGVDLQIMGPAMETPADEIYILTEDELRDWNVVTD